MVLNKVLCVKLWHYPVYRPHCQFCVSKDNHTPENTNKVVCEGSHLSRLSWGGATGLVLVIFQDHKNKKNNNSVFLTQFALPTNKVIRNVGLNRCWDLKILAGQSQDENFTRACGAKGLAEPGENTYLRVLWYQVTWRSRKRRQSSYQLLFSKRF